jgi:hypothetical protein
MNNTARMQRTLASQPQPRSTPADVRRWMIEAFIRGLRGDERPDRPTGLEHLELPRYLTRRKT